MRKALPFLLAICALAAFPVVHPGHTAGWVSEEEVVAGFLGMPLLLLSLLGALAGLVELIADPVHRGRGLLCLLLGAVMPFLIGMKRLRFEQSFDRPYSWYNQASGGGIVNFYIHRIVSANPEALHYIGETEEATVDGLVEAMAADAPIYFHDSSGRRQKMEIRDGKLFTPWGSRIHLAVDRNHDGFVTAGGQQGSTKYGCANPWSYDRQYQYARASGVFLTLPDAAITETDSTMVTLDDTDYNRLKETVEWQISYDKTR
jgi:hypothetical protein